MVALDQMLNPFANRFKQLAARSATVAQQRITAEDINVAISEEARERAINGLDYTLRIPEAWPATRALLLTLAPKMEMAGYRDKWIQYLQDGLALSRQQGDSLTEAELQFHCGYLYRLRSDYESARALLNASVTLAIELGKKQLQIQALNQLAYLAWQQHQHEEAEGLAHESLLMLDNTSLERAVSLSVLGLVATDQNRAQDAETYHRNALQIRTQHNEQRLMAWSLQNIGVALFQQGHYDTALEHYHQALPLLDRAHDLAHKAIVQMNIALVYHAQGEAHKALEIITIAEHALRKVCDEFNLAKLLTTKGLCYLALVEWKLAEYSFETSAQLFQKLGSYSWYLNSLDGLGISYLEQERYDEALTIFESVVVQLPQIEGTLAHRYLTSTLTGQLEQAKSQQVRRGQSVYVPPRNQDQQPPGGPPQANAAEVTVVPTMPSNTTGA